MAVASTALMFLVVIPAANSALGGKAYWAVFVATLVLEPSTGGWVQSQFGGGRSSCLLYLAGAAGLSHAIVGEERADGRRLGWQESGVAGALALRIWQLHAQAGITTRWVQRQ